jgi:hypothetical protein
MRESNKKAKSQPFGYNVMWKQNKTRRRLSTMAIIPNLLLSWEDEKNRLGDLERLKIVLETLPDEQFMQYLEKERGNGRDDFPVRAMWNLLIAGIIFGHKSIASLLRELYRNMQLVYICGFGFRKLPKACNMSRFITLLLKHENWIKKIFYELSQTLYGLLEGFGKELAIDRKWLDSAANRQSKRKKPDGRSETDATKGVKSYSGVSRDGTAWEKIVSCFGFKVHLLVDATHELPVAYTVTDAAASDITQGRNMLKEQIVNRPEILEVCGHLMGDKGYDDTELIELLKDKGVKAVIDKRTLWKAQEEKEVPGYEDAYYDEAGHVYCYTKEKGTRRMMILNGYEKDRDALRFKCPAQAYGVKCAEGGECRCRNIRIPLATDQRIFTQVQRESYKWKRLYKMRTAVERVNSRLDGAYGFEERRTRGITRTKLHVGLALLVMLSMAVWQAKNHQGGMVRSLLRVA